MGGTTAKAAKVKETRRARFDGMWQDVPVFDRYALRAGDTFAGPAMSRSAKRRPCWPRSDVLSVDTGRRLRTARPDGETLARSPRAMPVFNLTLPCAVKRCWRD